MIDYDDDADDNGDDDEDGLGDDSDKAGGGGGGGGDGGGRGGRGGGINAKRFKAEGGNSRYVPPRTQPSEDEEGGPFATYEDVKEWFGDDTKHDNRYVGWVCGCPILSALARARVREYDAQPSTAGFFCEGFFCDRIFFFCLAAPVGPTQDLREPAQVALFPCASPSVGCAWPDTGLTPRQRGAGCCGVVRRGGCVVSAGKCLL
jgi:hypothetical protein